MDHDGRFEALEDKLDRLFAHLGIDNQNNRPPTPNPNLRNHKDRLMKIDIPEFDGNSYDLNHIGSDSRKPRVSK